MPTYREQGFSYLWLLFLIALVGVGLAAIGQHSGLERQRLKERQLIFAGHQIRAAIERYRASTPAGRPVEYPSDLSELLEDRRGPRPLHHLRQLYLDPITGRNEWGLIWLDSRIVGIFSRSEVQPLMQDNFDSADADFVGAKRYADWRFTSPPRLPPEALLLYR